VAKLTAMYAAGDAVDVSLSPMQYLASYIEQGIAQPSNGLPGGQYVKDFTPFTGPSPSATGRLGCLLLDVWTFIYNDEMLAKRIQDRPFKSYPELIERPEAKRDGAAKYPSLVPAPASSSSPHVVQHDLQRAGSSSTGSSPAARRARSRARRCAVAEHLQEELADPNSLNLRFIPAVKASMRPHSISARCTTTT